MSRPPLKHFPFTRQWRIRFALNSVILCSSNTHCRCTYSICTYILISLGGKQTVARSASTASCLALSFSVLAGNASSGFKVLCQKEFLHNSVVRLSWSHLLGLSHLQVLSFNSSCLDLQSNCVNLQEHLQVRGSCTNKRFLLSEQGAQWYSFFTWTSGFSLQSHFWCSAKLKWIVCCVTIGLTRITCNVTLRVSVGTHSIASSLQQPPQRLRTTQEGI